MNLKELKKIEDEKSEILIKEKELRLRIMEHLNPELYKKIKAEKEEELKDSFKDFFGSEGFLIKEKNGEIIAEYNTFKVILNSEDNVYGITIPQKNYGVRILILEKYSTDLDTIKAIENHETIKAMNKKIEKLQNLLESIENSSGKSNKMNFVYEVYGRKFSKAKEILQVIIDYA